MSEMAQGKAVRQKLRKRGNSYIEDDFGSPTQYGDIVAICSRNQFLEVPFSLNIYFYAGGVTMGLSAPRRKIFFLSLLLVGIGIFTSYHYVAYFSSNAFWFVVAGYTVLATGSMFKGI